jgi:hypothetical protein
MPNGSNKLAFLDEDCFFFGLVKMHMVRSVLQKHLLLQEMTVSQQ